MAGIVVGSVIKSRSTGEQYKVSAILPSTEMVQVVPMDEATKGSLLFRPLNQFLV